MSRKESRNDIAKRERVTLKLEGSIIPDPQYITMPDGQGYKFVPEPKFKPITIAPTIAEPIKIQVRETPEQLAANIRKAEVIRAFGLTQKKTIVRRKS